MKLPSFIRQTLRGGFCLLLCAGLFSGCKRDEVKVYHVDSSDNSAPPPAAMPASMPAGLSVPDNTGLPPLKYVFPAGWQEKPASQMRVASFGISEDGKNADVSVIPLGGMAGGDFANVNRWRGQVGLPSLADDEIAKLAEKVSVGTQPADLYDITGGTQRILAVIFHRNDVAWFFKVTGDADLVEKQKPAFVSFLKSVQFGAPALAQAMDMTQLPPSHPPIDGMNPAAAPANADGGKSNWTVPPDWKQIDPGPMLTAKFSITGSDGSAEVNILSSGMDTGLAANVNRWRGQLGLPPVAQEDEFSKMVSSIKVGSGNAQVVDLIGTDSKTGKPTRLVGIIVPQNGQTGQTWFYKLMGDEPVVARQKDAFIQFVQSAKYPNAP
jgi:hypothetical protein